MEFPKAPEKAIYLLDTRGYVVLRNVFPKATIDEANRIIDDHLQGQQVLKFAFFHLDDLFLDLMQNPTVLSIAEHVLGDFFRMDHAFGVQQTRSGQINLHGGRSSGRGVHMWTSQGKRPMCHGQLSCSIALNYQGGDRGGVCCLPGSHYSTWPAEGYQIGTELFGHQIDDAVFDTPQLSPGDVMLFPECLVHGNKPWTSDYARRSLYYMYFPGHTTWRSWPGLQARHWDRARTPLEQRLLRAPAVGNFDDTGTQLGPNEKPGPTLGNRSHPR